MKGPVPGKLVHIKNPVISGCENPVRYFDVNDAASEDDTESDPFQYACGICAGKEDYAADRPTLTLEMLEESGVPKYLRRHFEETNENIIY